MTRRLTRSRPDGGGWHRRAGPALIFAVAVLAIAWMAASVRRPSGAGPGLEPGAPPLTTVSLAAPVAAARASIDDTLALDAAGCASVRSTVWHPLSGLDYTGLVQMRLPAAPGGAIVFFVGDRLPLDVQAHAPDGTALVIDRARLASPLAPDLPADYWLEDGDPWRAPGEITRVTIHSRPDRDLDVVVSLGRRAPRVVARLTGYAAAVRVGVCAAAPPEATPHFASGWSALASVVQGETIRWMGAYGVVLIRSQRDGEARIRLRAAPAVSPAPGEPIHLTLGVNAVFEAGARITTAELADYEWLIPDRAWVAGTNEILLRVSRTGRRGGRPVGLALASLDAQ